MTEKIKNKLKEASVPIRTLLGLSFMAVLIAVVVAYAGDADLDTMDDGYETIFSVNYTTETGDPALNYTNAADAALNYDSDSLVNSNEFVMRTDPFAADTDRDGFNDGVDDNPTSRAYIDWGKEFWLASLTNDTYDTTYTQPEWIDGVYKVDGAWDTNALAWYVDATNGSNVGSLCIDLKRTILTNDVVMSLTLDDTTNGVLYIGLIDSTNGVITDNLRGNIIAGTGNSQITTNLYIELGTYTDAVAIVIGRDSGEIRVYDTAIYVDEDQDGLDADQEDQLGTSDDSDDSDSDGLKDYAEVFTHYTDPSLLDSDNDGFSDGDEIDQGTDPNDTYEYPFSSYLYKTKIAFSGYDKPETLTNFPALVTLNQHISGFLYSQFASANGYDLRFSASDGMTELNYEVDAWDTNDNSYVWVQVPAVTSNSYVWAYWGNATATNQPAYCNDGSVWSEGYKGVWHLTDDDCKESTSGGFDGANTGSADIAGKIGNARDFEGADRITMPVAAFSTITTKVTISAWQYGDEAFQPQSDFLFEGKSDIGRELGVHLPWGNGTVYWDAFGSVDRITKVAGTNDYAGQWNHWVFERDGGTMQIYLNGVLWHSLSGKNKVYTPVTSFNLGANINGYAYYDGVIDEFRVSDVTRSADWIWASWLNTASNATFCTYDEVMSHVPSIEVGKASSVTHNSANLKATLQFDGNSDTSVTVYYGTNDIGISKVGWDNSISLGVCSEGSLSSSITGLVDKTAYYYRFYATNEFADSWTDDTGSFTTPIDMSEWSKKMNVSFVGYDYQQTEDLANFPALVVLSTSISNFSYSDFVSGDGYDLRFTDQSGTEELSYEIEAWDTNGNSYVWVNVPKVSGTGSRIYAYWGNASATNQQAYCTNGSVWSEGYKGVWHLGSDECSESTSSGYDGANTGSTNIVGVIGNARDFEGADYISIPVGAFSTITSKVTVSVWQYGDVAFQPQSDLLFEGRSSGGRELGAHVPWYDRSVYWEAFGNVDRIIKVAGANHYSGQWNHWVFERDGAAMQVYLNGELWHSGSGKNNTYTPVTSFNIGANCNGLYNYDGVIDEFRVSDVVRSAHWIWASWLNAADNSAFGLYSDVDSIVSGMGDDQDTLPDNWEESYFGNTFEFDEGDYDRDGLSNLGEYQAGTDPTDADSDDDGIPDGWEVDNGLDPLADVDASSDGDSDGLSSLGEYQAGTDPADDDSDDDGISDGVEVNTYGTLPTRVDSDDDGMPDDWEMTNGTAILYYDSNADYDNDLLSNYGECAAGTDPFDTDTDNDGVDDNIEFVQALSDPLTADHNGIVTTISTINGASAANSVGNWEVLGTAISSLGRRGALDYELSVTNDNVYRLEVEGSIEGAAFATLMLDVDGYYSGKSWLAGGSSSNKVCFFTPWLTNGLHTVTIRWDNIYEGQTLSVNAVRVQTMGGPDDDSNGEIDWIQNRLTTMCSVDVLSATSTVSPYCLEGDAYYLEKIEVTGVSAVPKHAGQGRWYIDVPLSSSGAVTPIISLQDGARIVTNSIVWADFNVLNESDANVRVGDSLLFTAEPAGATGGTVNIEIVGVTNFVTDISNPVEYQFAVAGSYTVMGTYSNGATELTDSVALEVIGAAFPTNIPAAWRGRNRFLYCSDLPSEGLVMSSDLDVNMDGIVEFDESGIRLDFMLNDVDSDHYIVARTSTNGSIVACTPIDGFWATTTIDDLFYIVEYLDDGSRVVENRLVASYLPDSVDIKLVIWVGGVTFEDGTSELIITADDLTEAGEFTYRMIVASPSNVPCHRMRAYQGTEYLGE